LSEYVEIRSSITNAGLTVEDVSDLMRNPAKIAAAAE
jgi:hypothetical protein